MLLDCRCLRLGGMQYSRTVTLCRSLRFQVLPVLRMRLWSGDHKATQTLRHGRHHSAQLHCGRQHTGADAPNASQRRLSVWQSFTKCEFPYNSCLNWTKTSSTEGFFLFCFRHHAGKAMFVPEALNAWVTRLDFFHPLFFFAAGLG